ncbi:hypothetical protein ACFOW2_04620 [Salinispirillum marinum]
MNTPLYSPERRLLCELSRAALEVERGGTDWQTLDIRLSAWCQSFGTDPQPAQHQIEFSLQQLKQRTLDAEQFPTYPTAWLVGFTKIDADRYQVEPSPWLSANLVQLACIIKLQDIYDTL